MFGGVFPLTKTSLTLACLLGLLLFALFTSASQSCLNLAVLAPKNNRRKRVPCMQIGTVHHIHYKQDKRGSPFPALIEAALLCSKSINEKLYRGQRHNNPFLLWSHFYSY